MFEGKLYFIAGHRRTGKTTLAEKICDAHDGDSLTYDNETRSLREILGITPNPPPDRKPRILIVVKQLGKYDQGLADWHIGRYGGARIQFSVKNPYRWIVEQGCLPRLEKVETDSQ